MNWILEVNVVPVSNVEKAKHFYEKQLGFIVEESDIERMGQNRPDFDGHELDNLMG